MFNIIGGDGKQYGPISSETIQQWILEGRANADTRVQPEGAAEWSSIGQMPEFASLLSKPAPPTPAGPGTMGAPMSFAPKPATNPMALTGMILGICSLTFGLLCCGTLMAIAGIVFSAVGLSQISKNPGQGGKGMAIAGLITSILGLIIGVILGLLFGLMGLVGDVSR